jgi:ligand-binding sensor domain-containing protein/GGDEF domain-containing protein
LAQFINKGKKLFLYFHFILKNSYFVLFSTLFFSLMSYAQDLKLFKGYGVENPMSYKFVRTIAQDKNSFMWFGSSEGLHKFDGYKTISFHHDSAKKNSLSSDVTSRIFIDKKQRLWVATHGGGLNLYREDSQDFFHITTKTENIPLTNDTVNALFEDSRGQLWIGTDNGLNVLTTSNESWSIKHIVQNLGKPKSLSHNTVNAIVELENQIWVGTNGGGISIFDLNGNFIKLVKLRKSNSNLYINKFIFSLFYDDKGSLWIGTIDKGLIKYSVDNGEFKHFEFIEDDPTSIISNIIGDVYQDSTGKIWIATDKGALIYDEKQNNFWRYNHAPNNPYSLSNDFILTFFEDRNNMMWIGTFTGVNRWDPNMTTFSQFSSRTHPVITNDNVTSFAQVSADKVIFSSYSGGLYQISLQKNVISHLDLNDYFAEIRIMTLFFDGNKLWVGTRSSGLFQVDLNTKAIVNFSHESHNKYSISANSITDIIKDREGNLWVSTFHQGVNRLNNDGTFTRYTMKEEKIETGPSSNHILQMLEDESGYLWLATYGGGINRFDYQNDAFMHLKHEDGNADSISSDLAWIILQDKSKGLWIGTQGAGLNYISHENMLNEVFAFEKVDAKDGMKSRTVYAIEEDLEGDLWISSNKGISRYSNQKKSFKHFDLSHGLVDIEYNHGAVFSDSQNNLYFGAGKGVTSLSPKIIKSEQVAPLIRLTDIYRLNEPMLFDKPLDSSSSIIFEHSDQLISFEYVGLNYANPNSTRYKYRLLGFDQQWIDAGKLRRATYTNLPQGSYTLQVIAGNNDDVWSEPYQLNIVMNPAPWKTWWAYMAYVAVIALALLSYSRFLNRKLAIEQLQKQDLKKQVEEKTKKYLAKNTELQLANKKLELTATIDKVTGIKSRRYLDIYIEQASQLMNQIHQNLLPVQRNILPRLYILMINIKDIHNVNNSQLVNFTDLLLYTRNNDDLLIRWSDETFAIIGYEKDNNVAELSARLVERFESVFKKTTSLNVAYSFYPFNREQPVDISWDQMSVLIEKGLRLIDQHSEYSWIGLYEPKEQPFEFIDMLQVTNLEELKQKIVLKVG